MKSHPIFCSITQEAGQGGIARVSSLIWTVLREASNDQCELIQVVPEGRQFANASDKLRFIGKMLSKHLMRNVDWIMYEHLGLARVQEVIPKSLSRPYVVFLYSIEAWNTLSPRRKEVLRQATVRIAISHHTARRIAAAHPDIGTIEVCHLALLPLQANGDSSGNAQKTSVRVIADNDHANDALLNRIRANSVLIVGRMLSSERHKGHDSLIKSWSQVVPAIPDAQLVIVGTGDDVERLKGEVVKAGLEENILFTGHITDATLEQIYDRVALFAMPSSGEGFGLVYLEAMRHRLPCIGSPADAAAEIIVHGETGLLIDQTDIDDLAENIVMLLNNPTLMQKMGEAGYERLQNVFTFEQFKQRLLNILEGTVMQDNDISMRQVSSQG